MHESIKQLLEGGAQERVVGGRESSIKSLITQVRT